AALNTLLGMGTVFLVLILISIIISGFGVIPKIQASFAPKKAEPVPEPVAPAPTAPVVEEEEEEELSDDLELVAVIAAAIASYEGTSVEGFQVRSIKRANTNKWRRK
ncbi:MAG: OadG family protein, partial [Lachnospiraceae bacterium]|nr:OadG family protein [Lachnospiraceae bacterium]